MTDQFQCRPQEICIDNEDVHTAQDVEQCHEWHQCCTHTGNALHTAQYHSSSQQADSQTGEVGRDMIGFTRNSGNGIGLNSIANTKGGYSSKQSKQYSQPFPAQPTLQRIHRSSLHPTVGGLHTILDGKQTLGIFRGDAKNTRQPTP